MIHLGGTIMPLSCPLIVIAGLNTVELVIICCPWGYIQVTPILTQILQNCLVYQFFSSENNWSFLLLSTVVIFKVRHTSPGGAREKKQEKATV